MTCFWDGVIKALQHKGLVSPKITTPHFITLLKQKVIKPNRVRWNNQSITHKQYLEYKEWISDYDIKKIGNGHLCSIWDPFLILISELFTLHIIHNYNGFTVNYTNTYNTNNNTIYFQSNSNHFWTHLK